MPADVKTLDLNFLNLPGAIAVYLVPHRGGAALVECGPGSTLPALQNALAEHGYTPADVTDVLVTHIHLDHAGAAGWWARQGARIHVHPNGAPHLANPEKLLASAGRIYGDMMDTLWGEFLSVPEAQLSVLDDRAEVEVGGLCFRAIDTPGHANHHFTYLLNDLAFTGDIGGIRLDDQRLVRLPMPPPEFNLEKWRESLVRLRQEFEQHAIQRIAPTHFGVYEDPGWHLSAIDQALDDVEAWMAATLPKDMSIEDLRQEFSTWNEADMISKGLHPGLVPVHEAANPSFMSADGMQRYWRKHRQAG